MSSTSLAALLARGAVKQAVEGIYAKTPCANVHYNVGRGCGRGRGRHPRGIAWRRLREHVPSLSATADFGWPQWHPELVATANLGRHRLMGWQHVACRAVR